MKIMKLNTIRKKIFLNSIIIIALTLSMILIGYIEFYESDKFSEQILPLTSQMAELVNFKGHFESFEHNLEEFLLISNEMQKDYINDDFDNLFDSIQNLRQYEYYVESVIEIESNCLNLKELITLLLSNSNSELSSKEMNTLFVNIYLKIKNINILHNLMSTENLEQIQYHVTAQHENIRLAILELFLIGFIILILYILLGLALSKNISGSILKLKKATAEIIKGNYNIKDEIENTDEIGELAADFKTMSIQLKKTINDLEESEGKYRMLFENANDAIVILDENHIFIDCNSKALEIFKVKSN